MRVIIAGSRHLIDYAALCACMDMAYLMRGIEPTLILSGHEPTGVDALGERWAREHGIPLETYVADWKRLPKTAGFIRNIHMSRRADALVAMMLKGGSPGTLHMIKQMPPERTWVTEVT